jgi:hypothetical protein
MNGPSLTLGASPEADVAEIARLSAPDAAAWPAYNALLDRYAAAFRPLLDRPPPDLGTVAPTMTVLHCVARGYIPCPCRRLLVARGQLGRAR